MTERITTAELDRLIDEGADITPYLDLEHAKVVPPRSQASAHEPVVVQLSMDPTKVIAIDHRARRCGQTRNEYVGSLIDAALALPA